MVSKIHWGDITHKEWIALRDEVQGIGDRSITRIGASDISILSGSNKWKCKQRLFYELTGYHSSFEITERTASGNLLEPLIIKRFEAYVPNSEALSLTNALNNIKERECEKATYFLLNDKYPNSFTSLDYTIHNQYSPFTGELYNTVTPIELKTTNWAYFSKWIDGCTQQYYEQLQYQMAISESEVAIFLVLVDGVNFHAKEVHANKEVQEYLLKLSKEFSDIVSVGKMALAEMALAKENNDIENYNSFLKIFQSVTPEVSELNDNLALLKDVYQEYNENVKEASDEDIHYMKAYINILEEEKKLQDEKNKTKAILLQSCESFCGIVSDSFEMRRKDKKLTKDLFTVKLKTKK